MRVRHLELGCKIRFYETGKQLANESRAFLRQTLKNYVKHGSGKLCKTKRDIWRFAHIHR